MAKIVIVEQSALGVGGHYFAYTGAIARAAVALDMETCVLHNINLKESWQIPEASTIPAFSYTWSQAEQAGIHDWRPGNIAFEFAQAIANIALSRDDHVLFHTLGKIDLENVLQYLLTLPPSSDRPHYHIILRYDVSELEPLMDRFGPLFERIRTAAGHNQFFFHTDTDSLTRDYRDLTGLDFNSLPIPFEQEPLKQALATGNATEGQALDIVYLGDARLEKNFHHIPAAAGYLWEDFLSTGKARFVLQCNFNTPGGETGQLAAVQQLAQYPTSAVRLIHEPQPTDDYYGILARAGIVIVPYCPDRYRSRSSGILVEAMAGGKPVITTRGSWMAEMVEESHAELIDSPLELGAALETILSDYDRYKRGAEQRAAALMDWSSGTNFVKSLVASVMKTTALSAPRVNLLLVMNGDAMELRNGASLIVRAQVRYLSLANFNITGLFLSRKTGLPHEIAHHMASIAASIAELPFDDAYVCAPSAASFDPVLAKRVGTTGQFTIADDLKLSRCIPFGGDILAGLRRNPPDAILLNYITNYGVIESLGLESVPLICEMHDIQSFQNAIYGERKVSDEDLALEFETLGKCDYLISLNPIETRYVEERQPGVPCVTTGVQYPPVHIDYGTLAGVRTLSDVIMMCDPAKFGARQGQSPMVRDILDRIDWLDKVDLLFVSSNHKANASGLRWFLYDIFMPHLAPLGVTLFVAGSVDQMGPWPESPYIVFLGRVDDLKPLYAAAKVVILPIIEGAGSPVKTYEAISYRKPIVATRLAVRAFTTHPTGIDISDEVSFADRILELVDDVELRDRQRELLGRTLADLGAGSRFDETMDKVFEDLLGQAPKRIDGTILAPTEVSHVEWGSATFYASKLLRRLIIESSASLESLRALANVPPMRRRAILCEMLEALVVRQDAPILAIDRALGKAVRGLRSRGREAANNLLALAEAFISCTATAQARANTAIWLADRPLALRMIAPTREYSADAQIGEAKPAREATDILCWNISSKAKVKNVSTLDILTLDGPANRAASLILTQEVIPHGARVRCSDLGLAAEDTLVVELFFHGALRDGHFPTLKLDENWLHLDQHHLQGRSIYRATLCQADLEGLGEHTLTVQTVNAKGIKTTAPSYGIRLHRICGVSGSAILNVLAMQRSSGAALDTNAESTNLQVEALARSLKAGLAFSPADARMQHSAASLPSNEAGRLLRQIFEEADSSGSFFASPLLRIAYFDHSGAQLPCDAIETLPGDRLAAWSNIPPREAAQIRVQICKADFGRWPAALVAVEDEGRNGCRVTIPIQLLANAQVRLHFLETPDWVPPAGLLAYVNRSRVDCSLVNDKASGECFVELENIPPADPQMLGCEIMLLAFGASADGGQSLGAAQLNAAEIVMTLA